MKIELWQLFFTVVAYLGVLFLVAYAAERGWIARRLLAKGIVGKLKHFYCYMAQDYRGVGSWRMVNKIAGGGQINDSGSHYQDIMIWMTGLMPVRAFGATDKYMGGTLRDIEVNSSHHVEFEKGLTGRIIIIGDYIAGFVDDVIIDGATFDVQAGEAFMIAGGSGCGKSTLLKHMIGLYRPAGGHVLIDGEDLVGASGTDRERILNKIGVTYQMGALFGDLTLLENVRLPLEEFTELPAEAMDVIALMKLRLVGLAPFALRPV